MACTDGNLKIWNRVPIGARLHLSVVDVADDGGDDVAQRVIATARLRHSGPDEDWLDAEIHPGPKSMQLQDRCGLTVNVAFAGAGQVQVKSWIDKDGNQDGENFHGDPYCFPVQGANGDVVTATIIVVTKKN